MVVSLTANLSSALQDIEFTSDYHEFPLHLQEQLRTDEILTPYGAAKWGIIDLLNQRYSSLLPDKFDLYHWLSENTEDEVAYFLNEAGSNSLTHSQYKAPSKFRLWLGKKSFVIAIEQQGKGFPAEEVSRSTPGGFFNFFKNSKSVVFFDNPQEARIVFLQFSF